MDEDGSRKVCSVQWELQKENLQPLSSGRNISILEHSLETTKNIVEHEKDVETHVRELEEKVKNSQNEELLNNFVELITYLENQCLLDLKFKTKLGQTRCNCVMRCLKRPEFANDKRLIHIAIKTLENYSPEHQIKILKGYKCGTTVSTFYTHIAELQESLHRPQEALQTLKDGIAAGAQPVEILEEAIKNLEVRMVQSIVKNIKGNEDSSSTIQSRSLGKVVPTYGPKNEAPAFRNDLEFATPLKSEFGFRPKQKPLPLFSDAAEGSSVRNSVANSENQPPQEQSSDENGRKSKAVHVWDLDPPTRPNNAKENNIKASKWNKSEQVMEFASVPESKAVKLYVENSEPTPVIPRNCVVKSGVLSERKESKPLESVAVAEFPVGGSQTVQTSSKPTQQPVLKSLHDNARLMFRREYLPDGTEKSTEHLKMEAWMKARKELENVKALENEITKLTNEKYKLEIKLQDATAKIVTLEKDKLEMEQHVEMIQSEKQQLADQLEERDQLVESLKNELETAKTQRNRDPENQYSMVMDIEADGENDGGDEISFNASYKMAGATTIFESNNKTRYGLGQKQLSLDDEDDESGVKAESEANQMPPPPPVASSKKLPFTLYESISKPSPCTGRGKRQDFEAKKTSVDYKTLSENVRPLSVPAPVQPSPEIQEPTAQKFAAVIPSTCSSNLNFKPLCKPRNSHGDKDPLTSNPEFSERLKRLEEMGRQTQEHTSEKKNSNGAGPIPSDSILLEPPFEPYKQGKTKSNNNVDVPLQSGKLDFDVSDLTTALASLPKPILNSTPQRTIKSMLPVNNNEIDSNGNTRKGNFVHTQKIPLPPLLSAEVSHQIDGPMSPESRERDLLAKRHNISSVPPRSDLSPITETSKENRSSTTSSSSGTSGSNLTTTTSHLTRTGSAAGISMFNSRSVSGPTHNTQRFNYNSRF